MGIRADAGRCALSLRGTLFFFHCGRAALRRWWLKVYPAQVLMRQAGRPPVRSQRLESPFGQGGPLGKSLDNCGGYLRTGLRFIFPAGVQKRIENWVLSAGSWDGCFRSFLGLVM